MLKYLGGHHPSTLGDRHTSLFLAHSALPASSEQITAVIGFRGLPADLRRDDVRQGPDLSLRYAVWPGRDEINQDNPEPDHLFLEYTTPQQGLDLEGYIPPTITTFHGHDLLCPYGVLCEPIGPDGPKTRLMVLTILRADGDPSRAQRAIAWQGDNDSIHISQPLAGETELVMPSQANLFGVAQGRSEASQFRLALAVHGPSALLDFDVEKLPLVTPGKALKA